MVFTVKIFTKKTRKVVSYFHVILVIHLLSILVSFTFFLFFKFTVLQRKKKSTFPLSCFAFLFKVANFFAHFLMIIYALSHWLFIYTCLEYNQCSLSCVMEMLCISSGDGCEVRIQTSCKEKY